MNEQELFKTLSTTEVGKTLADYCDKLILEVCDSRNWEEGEDKVHANKTAKVIQERIIDRIRKKNIQNKPYVFPYE